MKGALPPASFPRPARTGPRPVLCTCRSTPGMAGCPPHRMPRKRRPARNIRTHASFADAVDRWEPEKFYCKTDENTQRARSPGRASFRRLAWLLRASSGRGKEARFFVHPSDGIANPRTQEEQHGQRHRKRRQRNTDGSDAPSAGAPPTPHAPPPRPRVPRRRRERVFPCHPPFRRAIFTSSGQEDGPPDRRRTHRTGIVFQTHFLAFASDVEPEITTLPRRNETPCERRATARAFSMFCFGE